MIEIYGSVVIYGFLAFDPQPSISNIVCVNVLNCKSRVVIKSDPPKIPSTSLPTLGFPLNDCPIYVGMWKRIYSQLPPVWSPVQTLAYLWNPAHPSNDTTVGRFPLLAKILYPSLTEFNAIEYPDPTQATSVFNADTPPTLTSFWKSRKFWKPLYRESCSEASGVKAACVHNPERTPLASAYSVNDAKLATLASTTLSLRVVSSPLVRVW